MKDFHEPYNSILKKMMDITDYIEKYNSHLTEAQYEEKIKEWEALSKELNRAGKDRFEELKRLMCEKKQ